MKPRAATPDRRSVRAAPEDAEPLRAERVSVRFGGLHALRGVDVRVGPGEIVGLIGGNGAGKTTFVDVVSGYVAPEPGSSIRSFGHELNGVSPELRPYIGVGRSFQHARLFGGLTVEESLLVALERYEPTGVFASALKLPWGRRAEERKRANVDELIETMGLNPFREKLTSELSTGTRRVVDLACILAQRPRLLLLDEPTTGLAQKETEAFGPLLRRVQDQLGCAILVIEHDIPLIMSIADRLYALETGRVIAEGEPKAIMSDPRVIASYLGTDETAIRRSGARTHALRSSRRTRRQTANGRLRKRQLERLTRTELLRLASERGIIGRSRMRKTELVALLARR